MKKSLCITMLLLSLALPVFAWIPLLISVVPASLALHAIAYSVGVFLSMTPGGIPGVTPTADVTRPSNAQWIDLTLPIPAVVDKPITASIPLAKIKEIANTKPTEYPSLGASLLKSGILSVHNETAFPIGTVFDNGGDNGFGMMKSTGGSNLYSANRPGPIGCVGTTAGGNPGVCSGGPVYRYFNIGVDWYRQTVVWATQPEIDAVPKIDKNPTEWRNSVAENGISGPVKSNYQAELDKMLQDPMYTPVFTDDTTGLPFANPPNAATPGQVSEHNKGGVAPSTTTTGPTNIVNNPNGTSTGTTTTTTTGGNGGSTTTTVVNQYGGTNGTGPITGTETTDNGSAPPPLPAENVYAPATDSDKPEKKNITTLLDTLTAGSPLVSMVNSFTMSASGTGVVPIGTVYGKELTFDFTHWEAAMRACGGILIIIMHGYAIFVVVRGW